MNVAHGFEGALGDEGGQVVEDLPLQHRAAPGLAAHGEVPCRACPPCRRPRGYP